LHFAFSAVRLASSSLKECAGLDPKTYVLDTCVLLADPRAPLRFDEHDVVLPLVVVEELDKKKTGLNEVGANARLAIRLLEELGRLVPAGSPRPAASPPGGAYGSS